MYKMNIKKKSFEKLTEYTFFYLKRLSLFHWKKEEKNKYQKPDICIK